MIALLTSCGRPDLLNITIESLLANKEIREMIRAIIVHEDMIEATAGMINIPNNVMIVDSRGVGQHKSIEGFIRNFGTTSKYYLHLEDDWQFDNKYNWIKASVDIMESDDTIIKVLASKDTPHPCIHDLQLNGYEYGILKAWENNRIVWNGFSWNPGVTRLDYLKQFVPFRQWEQELAGDIAHKGFRVAELKDKIYTHIGDGRSTHE